MRIRNDTLSAGSLLASLDPDRPENNHGLLFLVAGADDIEPLTEIERTCRDFIEGQEQPLRKGFAWYAVSSYGQDGPMDPRGRVPSPKRLEVREFHGLARADLEKLLHPVLDRLARGEPELLPSAGAAVGAPAEGVQFLDRTSELGELLRLLRGGKSVILLAPRRSGKTSLMRRAQVVLESECRLVSLNLERDNTPEKVAARLRTIVSGEPFRQALGRVQGDPTGSIRQSIEDLARRATPSHPLVLLLDELVALLDNRPVPFDENVHRRGALGFLQAIAEPAAKLGARCAVAGSVDLFHYLAQTLDLAQEDLPTLLREIVPLHLKPLALDSPEIELRRVLMGSGLVLEPAEVSWLVEHVDLALPFPAMKLLDRLTAQSAAPPGLTLDDGRRLLADFVATTDAFEDFDLHIERKGAEIPAAGVAVAAALDIVARQPFAQGAPVEHVRAAVQQHAAQHERVLYEWLLQTFPLEQRNGRVAFVSRLFRHWWRAQIGADEEAT